MRLSVLLEGGQSARWLAAPRCDLLPNPVRGRDFAPAGQALGRPGRTRLGQEPAEPSSLSEVFLRVRRGGFALVTYVIHQTSGGWIRQSDVAR